MMLTCIMIKFDIFFLSPHHSILFLLLFLGNFLNGSYPFFGGFLFCLFVSYHILPFSIISSCAHVMGVLLVPQYSIFLILYYYSLFLWFLFSPVLYIMCFLALFLLFNLSFIIIFHSLFSFSKSRPSSIASAQLHQQHLYSAAPAASLTIRHHRCTIVAFIKAVTTASLSAAPATSLYGTIVAHRCLH
ncbi:unnamed protein product [Prunus brigantina]